MRFHAVSWASGAPVQTIIEQAGLPFHPVAETGWRWPPPPPLPMDPNDDGTTHQQQMMIRSLDQWLDLERVTAATEDLITLGYDWQPDVIVSENFVSAAALVAEKLSIPLAVVGWPAPNTLPPQKSTSPPPLASIFVEARRRLDSILATFDLQGTNWSMIGPPALCSPHLHVTYWSPSWFTGVPIGKQTQHVGGQTNESIATSTILEKLPAPELAPWVLITLGTTFGNDPNFFITAAHAAKNMGCLPLLALGGQIPQAELPKLRARLPRSTVVAQFLPLAEILPHVSAVIHHGGVGTTHAAIVHGIPQIIVPHAGDQRRQAQGIQRTKAGIAMLPKDVTLDDLSQSLARLLPDLSPMRANAQALQAEFATLGGVDRAADLLEHLV